jgi:hypothetical protein
MRTSAFHLTGILALLATTLLACNLAGRVINPTRADTEALMPKAGVATPTQTVPSVTETLIPTATVSGKSGEYYGAVQIIGSSDFVIQTRLALSLLETKAPEAYRKIQTYVGLIEQGQHSGMWVWEEPPRYEVGDATAFSSLTWYASTIAHDATHSELYHNGQEWEGIPAEQFCNTYQLEVLKQLAAPQDEIDYLASQTGDHCDVDRDGDCDWTDYENRDW